MAKRSIVDHLASSRPGIPTRKLILIITAVVVSGLVIGSILGRLFPEWLPVRPTALPSATQPSTTQSATTQPATTQAATAPR
jgi:hypothetical protein